MDCEFCFVFLHISGINVYSSCVFRTTVSLVSNYFYDMDTYWMTPLSFINILLLNVEAGAGSIGPLTAPELQLIALHSLLLISPVRFCYPLTPLSLYWLLSAGLIRLLSGRSNLEECTFIYLFFFWYSIFDFSNLTYFYSLKLHFQKYDLNSKIIHTLYVFVYVIFFLHFFVLFLEM